MDDLRAMATTSTAEPPAAPSAGHGRGAEKRLAHVAFGRQPESIPLHWYRVMEEALDRLGVPRVVHPKNPLLRDAARGLSKLRLIRPVARLSRRAYLIPIMQPEEYRFFPVAYWGEVVPFCFDIWPPRWPKWEAMFRRHRVRVAFFTARQSAEEFARRIPGMECLWVPEATDPRYLKPEKLLTERSIDVLEMGRRYDAYHDLITPRLAAAGRRHLFERVKGEMIYTRFADTAAGYGDAKVALAFPSALTHPERSGPVETVTMRYYEIMASRCLLVGRCPAELRDDFGYNPVVEADMDRAADQIEGILADVGRYQELVDRNHRTTLERGTWDARFATVLSELRRRGYSTGAG
jgi:hypothetical protein